jgi:hypothetical protein
MEGQDEKSSPEERRKKISSQNLHLRLKMGSFPAEHISFSNGGHDFNKKNNAMYALQLQPRIKEDYEFWHCSWV